MNNSTRAKLVSLVIGWFVVPAASAVVNFGIPAASLSSLPSQLTGLLVGWADIILVLGFAYTLGNFGHGNKQRTRDRALAIALGFALMGLGVVISLAITFSTYDNSLLILTAVLLGTAAYTTISLWQNIALDRAA